MAQNVDPGFNVAFIVGADEGGAAVVDGSVEEAFEGEGEGEGAGAGDAGADDLDLGLGLLCGVLRWEGGTGTGGVLAHCCLFFCGVCMYVCNGGEGKCGFYTFGYAFGGALGEGKDGILRIMIFRWLGSEQRVVTDIMVVVECPEPAIMRLYTSYTACDDDDDGEAFWLSN